jgi:hypothetical protein
MACPERFEAEQIVFKNCARCGETKGENEFHKDAVNHDGLTAYCAACRNELNRELYARKQKQILQKEKKFYSSNRERILARRRELYRQKIAEKGKENGYDEQKEHLASGQNSALACHLEKQSYACIQS